MLNNPKHGWCDFKLNDFTGTPSYLTDVPIDILNAFISFHENGYGMACFDEEGKEFSLVLTLYGVYIIEEREKTPLLHNFSWASVKDLEKEVINDIEQNIDEWGLFVTSDSEEDIKEHKEEILRKISILKNK